jgi:hypothetical protein
MERLRTLLTMAAVVAASGISLGCGTTKAEPDAAPPPDTGPAADSRSDSRTEPTACVPAACDAADGGTDAYQPPWGCPEGCEPGCEGDTVCCDDGTCQWRGWHNCEEGCDLELTIYTPLIQLHGAFHRDLTAWVCNRGTTLEAAPGQVVRFESEQGTECEAVTTAPISTCSCVPVSCDAVLETYRIRPLLNPDTPLPECGSPWGHIAHEAWYHLY